ncbi:MAG: TolC family protein [Candidatus Aminicenantes bacterium]|nr:TolC family protein [Candidatus Aminicenantes bacterium]
MSRIKGIVAVLILAGPAALGIPQERPTEAVDLSGAIRMALARNRDLARSAFGMSINALDVIRAESAFRLDVRPELYLNSEGSRTATGGGLSVSQKLPWGTQASVEGILAGSSGDGSPLRQKVLQVEISQPLFRNFGALVQREPVVQARQNYRAALRTLEMEKSALALRVIESYESILQLGRRVLVEQASADRMEKLVRLTRAKEVLGRTTRVDTLRAELLRGQAQFRLETIRETLSFEQRDFAELLGADPDTVFDLKPTVLLEVNVPPLEESLKMALRNRLDYAQALQDGADAARGIRIAGRKLLPGLNLVARKSWTEGDALVSVATSNDHWAVGLSLDMNVNLKEERAALEQARLYGSSADLATGIVELSIAREVNQQRAAYRRARAALGISERNKDLAASRQKLAQRLFELGRGDQFSVTDAEETFLEAENQWLSARAEASLAGFRLLYVLGTLVETPDDLKPRSASE